MLTTVFLKEFKCFQNIDLVKDPYLRSLQGYGDQAITGQIKKHICKHVLAILRTNLRPDFREKNQHFYEVKQRQKNY